MTKAPQRRDPNTGAPAADRQGLWGRGRHGGGFHRQDQREYSREDYGTTGRGPDVKSPPGAEDIGTGTGQAAQKRSTSSTPGPRGRSSQPAAGAPGKATR